MMIPVVGVGVRVGVGVGGAGITVTPEVSPCTVPVVVEIQQGVPSSTTHHVPEASLPTISSVVPVGRMRMTS
jgi:hypothetical protein